MSNDNTAESHRDGSSPQTLNTRDHVTAVLSPLTSISSALPRSTILHHHKTPLLLSTPPLVTRALAHSHHLILPLCHLAGLVTWTTDDPWQSFLLLISFWFAILYGDSALRFAGPLVFTVLLAWALYLRRYSPSSSTSWTSGSSQKHQRSKSNVDGPSERHKSLDEILATIQVFTTRCDILLNPLLLFIDFVSTPQTATTATTRPALISLFFRLVLASPVWVILALPPIRLITSRRIALLVGTLILSWHSRPASVIRLILWRSRHVRIICGLLTGMSFAAPKPVNAKATMTSKVPTAAALAQSNEPHNKRKIRFTFAVYENQRRWIGLGWTANLFAYERAPWTDEYLNATVNVQQFQLPSIEGSSAVWQWVTDSQWHIEGQASSEKVSKTAEDDSGWVFYDNKWRDGVRGQDLWSKYTRRRKWIREAELVDVSGADTAVALDENTTKMVTGADVFDSASSQKSQSTKLRRSWFGKPAAERSRASSIGSSSKSSSKQRPRRASNASHASHAGSTDGQIKITQSRVAERDDVIVSDYERNSEWGLSEGVSMGMG